MNQVNGVNNELAYYNKSSHSLQLKLIISIALGFISLLLSPYSIHTQLGVTRIDIPWSLLFPIIISISFGWRFGLLSAIAGAALFPFLLWPENGFANFLTSFLYIFYFTSIGFANGTKDFKRGRYFFYRYLLIVSIFITLLSFSYLFLFEKLLSLNHLYWTNNTIIRIDYNILVFFLIKDSINILFLIVVADLLLRLPVIRRLFGLSIDNTMRFNHKISYFSLLISILIWFSYFGLSIVLLNHNGFLDGHLILALLIIVVGCLFAARVVIYYSEKQIGAFNKQKESEAYLKLQIEKMPIGYVVWDKELRVISWNPSAEKIFGFTSNETVGKTAYETIVPRHIQENVSKVWHDLKFKGIESRNINENLTKSGEIIICEWTNTPIKDIEGNTIEIISMVQDITERIMADELIRETKANLSAIIENNSDSIWAINTSYEIIYINNVFKQAYLDSFGVLLEVGMNVVNAVPEPIRPQWKARYDRAFTNERFMIEDRIDLGFTILYIELAVNPILIDGNVVGASLFSRDITERKKAEEALRISEERFKVVSESAEEWIWEVDINGLYTYSNSIVERILGYLPDEIVGKKYFFDFFDPEYKDQYLENTLSTFKNILAFKEFENVNIHKNGSRVICKTSGSPILNSDGELVGYRGADTDITIQKRIETALLESEEKYRLTFTTSPDSVNINTMNGIYVDINDGYTQLTGYTREDVIGVSSLDIDIWYFAEDRKKLIKHLLKEGYVSNLESVFRCKDGTLKTALMSARIIQINNTPHILSITRDITERKLLESTLVESEKKYRKLFERSNDAIFIIDKKTGKYLDANKSAERITGYSLNELKKLATSDITPVDSKKRLSKIVNINKAIELGEIEYFRPDGTSRHTLLSVIPLSDDKVYGIAHDITERKQFEDALSILSSAVDQSPVSVVITDTNGLIEYANPKFSEITGYGLDEVIGKNPSVLKSGYTSNEEYENLWKTISSGKEWRGVFHNKKKNGEMFWESALISPITNESGKTTHYLAVKEDITEKKEAERRILSSIIDTEEKERNRFSRELHDGLGPLLSTIKLYFQWISETNDQEKKKLISEKGEKNINEAIETIREVSNNLSPRTLNTFGAIVAIHNFIDNVNHTQKILINLKSNTESRFEKNLETVLYRVTSELINNTLKYAKASKAEVNIFYEQTNNRIKLTYFDNGIGFNMESMLSKGKGLGLVNIEQRVNSLEGKFKIDSSDGHGVFVEIELPAPMLQIND